MYDCILRIKGDTPLNRILISESNLGLVVHPFVPFDNICGVSTPFLEYAHLCDYTYFVLDQDVSDRSFSNVLGQPVHVDCQWKHAVVHNLALQTDVKLKVCLKRIHIFHQFIGVDWIHFVVLDLEVGEFGLLLYFYCLDEVQ